MGDCDVFGRSDATGHGNAGFSGRGPLFKITDSDLDIVGDFDFGMPTPPNLDSSKIKALDDPKTSTIVYNYDFGDGWEHIFTACQNGGSIRRVRY
jgi:hypothetical protein